MAELLPRLIPLKGDFDLQRSLVDCSYIRDDLAVGGPTIRFSLGIGNVGTGPLHLILFNIREEAGKKIASAKQRVYSNDGKFREINVDDVERTRHDVHDAWHYPNLASFGLYDKEGKLAAPGKKTQYCMVDVFKLTDAVLNKFAVTNSPETGRFSAVSGCLPDIGTPEIGISVGWADNYQQNVADQYIDISDIKTGVYTLQLQVNKTKLVTADGDNTPREQHRIRIDKEQQKVEAL